MGFGSDGAGVMAGRGVAARLCDDAPSMINIHCVAHHLALATITATDDCPAIKKYEKTLKDVCNYLAHSTTRKVELHFWQTVYDDPAISIKSFTSVRGCLF